MWLHGGNPEGAEIYGSVSDDTYRSSTISNAFAQTLDLFLFLYCMSSQEYRFANVASTSVTRDVIDGVSNMSPRRIPVVMTNCQS